MGDEKKAQGRYEVGRGKPPKHSQFKPGQSGNPKGRPKGTKSRPTDVAGILGEPLTVKKAGTTQEMAPFEVGVRQLVKKALNNNSLKAILAFVSLCERYGIIAPQTPPERRGGVLVVPKTWDWDEWMRMFEEHGPPPWPGERSGLPGETGISSAQEEQ